MESLLEKKRKEDPIISIPFLENLEKASIKKTSELSVVSEVKKSFPNLSSFPKLAFISSKKEKKEPSSPLKIGVVFSGGPAPGGHNVLYGMMKALQKIDTRSVLYGFLGGPIGVVEGKVKKLTPSLLQKYRNQGGFDLIGSGRDKIEKPEEFEKAACTVQKLALNGLVIIGGDDSNTNAAFLAEYFLAKNIETRVIGVPKTIDGDLQTEDIEISFGFHTATKTYSETIGNIARDALSSKKYYHFIRIMGRSASHVALECALQTNPNYFFLREEIEEKKLSLEKIVSILEKLIIKRSKAKKRYGIILFPEGMIEAISEIKSLIEELNKLKNSSFEKIASQLPQKERKTFLALPFSIQNQLMLEKDPHGNIPVSKIETERLFLQIITDRLTKKKIPFEGVPHFLGYEGRCSFPSLFDSTYCYYLGKVAIELIHKKATGYMAAISHLKKPFLSWKALGIPLASLIHFELRKGKKKAVIKKTLVDTKDPKIKKILDKRSLNPEKDRYLFPGPTQFINQDPFLGEKPYILYFK